jgi:type IV secretory pathway TrbD component
MIDDRRATPLHQALVEPMLIAGVEKPFAIVNVTLAITLVGDLHLWGWLPIAVLAHLVLRHITRDDPFTRQIYVRYNRQPDSYDPWVHVRMRRGLRPAGYGRGMPC